MVPTMRRQDAWIAFADRYNTDRRLTVACLVFLNMGRTDQWVAQQLRTTEEFVAYLRAHARPLLRVKEARSCTYCGAVATGKDHKKPRSRGGSSQPENLDWACINCNSAKGARTPEEWLG